jgi:hypothetical protein
MLLHIDALQTTVVCVINAYIAAQKSPDVRRTIRDELQQLGFHQVLSMATAELGNDPDLEVLCFQCKYDNLRTA